MGDVEFTELQIRYKQVWVSNCSFASRQLLNYAHAGKSSLLPFMSIFNNNSDGDTHDRRFPYRSCFEVDRRDGRLPLDSLGDVARREAAHGDRVPAFVVDGNLVADALAGVESTKCEWSTGTAAPRTYVASMLFMYTVKEMCVSLKQTIINEKIGLTFTAWGETEEEPERVWERQKLRPT